MYNVSYSVSYGCSLDTLDWTDYVGKTIRVLWYFFARHRRRQSDNGNGRFRMGEMMENKINCRGSRNRRKGERERERNGEYGKNRALTTIDHHWNACAHANNKFHATTNGNVYAFSSRASRRLFPHFPWLLCSCGPSSHFTLTSADGFLFLSYGAFSCFVRSYWRIGWVDRWSECRLCTHGQSNKWVRRFAGGKTHIKQTRATINWTNNPILVMKFVYSRILSIKQSKKWLVNCFDDRYSTEMDRNYPTQLW